MNSQTRFLSVSDTEAAASSHSNRGRHRGGQIKFFTIAEVAELLGVSTRTVRRWTKPGRLVAHHIGSVVRIADGDLRAFLDAHRGDEL